MPAKVLMIQGTTSNAGKSVLTAGLCRWLRNRNRSVAPFKPQNMSLNSAVTVDGGEIGRAQAMQAQACGILPTIDMNPVLLKPNSATGAQVIVQGRAIGNMNAVQYHEYKRKVMKPVLASFHRLSTAYEYIVVEGAGSPAEINLRDGDIANMGFAEAVDCPVLLVSDIERGGVFAHLYGTLAVLASSERDRIGGLVINRFRGDKTLLTSGIDWLEQETKKRVVGVLPFLDNLRLEAEDSLSSRLHDRQEARSDSCLRVAVLRTPRVSNDTDFDALFENPTISLSFVDPSQEIPPADLLILPGSKNVREDLQFLQLRSWDREIRRHLRYGGKIIGICGGFQMLGKMIHDPDGLESAAGSSIGLGFLDMETTLATQKQLKLVTGTVSLTQAPVRGYEIHMGVSRGPGLDRPLIIFSDRTDGAISDDNQIIGTYVHGLFDSPEACRSLLEWAGAAHPSTVDLSALFETRINHLADNLVQHLDMNYIEHLFASSTFSQQVRGR